MGLCLFSLFSVFTEILLDINLTYQITTSAQSVGALPSILQWCRWYIKLEKAMEEEVAARLDSYKYQTKTVSVVWKEINQRCILLTLKCFVLGHFVCGDLIHMSVPLLSLPWPLGVLYWVKPPGGITLSRAGTRMWNKSCGSLWCSAAEWINSPQTEMSQQLFKYGCHKICTFVFLSG